MQDDSKKTASELSMDNVGGVFVVLMAGMGLGTLKHREKPGLPMSLLLTLLKRSRG
jgi:hypothetical protein